MSHSVNNLVKLVTIILLTTALYMMSPPVGLSQQGWHLLTIFMGTIAGVMLSPLPMGAVIMISITSCILTNTLTVDQAMLGFSSKIAWLVVFAFFIAKGLIKSQLGRRAGYFFIAKFGRSTLGLSYSLILTELLIAPAIPSASARGGGIIFPIANSLSDQYSSIASSENATPNIKSFMMQLCFHTNIITSAMFLTSMAGNPVIAALALGIGIEITWTNWALAAIVPGIISLTLLPIVLKYITKLETYNLEQAPILARKALSEMGPFSRNEFVVLIIFAVLITLWILSETLKIEPTTTALLGFLAMIITSVITWEDAMHENEAWKTFIWFAGFITLSKFLSDTGVTIWIGDQFQSLLNQQSRLVALPCLGLVFFFMHYAFASITVFASVTFTTFALLFISMGIPPLVTALGLAIFANLSACLTHYGIAPAPIFFGGSHLSTAVWWKNGFIMAIFHIILWLTVCSAWWKVLGWW